MADLCANRLVAQVIPCRVFTATNTGDDFYKGFFNKYDQLIDVIFAVMTVNMMINIIFFAYGHNERFYLFASPTGELIHLHSIKEKFCGFKRLII